MRVTGRKTLLILCLASILLITGAGLSLAAGAPDYDLVIDDLSGLLEKVVKLSPEQAEQAVGISGVLANELFNGGVLSDLEKTALENTLNVKYSTYTEVKSALEEYIADYASGGKTGYAGLLNAINPDSPDMEYLMGFVLQLYNAVGPETRAQLESKGITFDELVSIAAELGQIQFGPGLEITEDVRQQIAAILQEIVDESDLTQEEMTACGLTVDNITELYGKLTTEQKTLLEDILTTMGLISGGDQEKPQVATYQPGKNAQDVPLDVVVSATFDRDVTAVDLSGVKIEAGGSPLAGTGATLEGRVLSISHPAFQFETTYTVTIPAGRVQAGSITNDEIKWSFETLPESGEYRLTLDVQYNSDNDTVTSSGKLTKRDEAQTPVRDVAIGLVIEKGGVQYAIAQGLTDGSGAFGKTFSTASFASGTYTVTATANLLTKQGSFTIPGGVVVVKPTVETNNATGITTTSATLNGNITNTGGENCTVRKFVYRLQGAVDWTNAGEEHGSFGIGGFSFTLTGLTQNNIYEFKAMAYNNAGWGEGSVLTFTTYRTTTGGGGGGGGSTCELNVDTYLPAVNAENVAIDTVVKVTFKQNIEAVDLTKVSVKDAQNNIVSGVTATVDGKVLTIAHDNFAYNTKYTVSVPYGTVKRSDCTANNSSLSWSFTTAKETIPTPPCVYSDVQDSYWAAGVIKELCEKGILDGYPDGTFRPRNDITRAEFAKIMVVALGLAEENTATPTFKDVAPGDWYYGVVEAASKAGLVEGYGKGLFKPNAKITREEITAILVRALGKQDEAAAKANTMTSFKDNHDISSWARGSVVVAFNEGLIKGYPNGAFGPKKNAIRAEVCAMVSRMLAKL